MTSITRSRALSLGAAAFFAILAAGIGGAQAETPKPAAAAAEALPLYLFVYKAGPAWKEGLPMAQQDMRPHGLYIKDLFEKGVVFAGGAFDPAEGGMAIVRADSLDAARAIFEADPAITSGIFVGEIVVWRPRFHGPGALLPSAEGAP